jgi:penicillin V acylase-like amidase (Ntn superfamily)
MDEIYANMNNALLMAHAARRAEASYGKLAQLKADTIAAEQAQQWLSHLCWWLRITC